MPRRALILWLVLASAACAGLAWALLAGSAPIGASEVWAALVGAHGGQNGAAGVVQATSSADIVLKLRLPRALAAFGVGALLALAGALMQILLRNPLAEPYLLGISGGAAEGALSAMLLEASLGVINAGSAVGAAVAIFLVLGLARRDFAAALQEDDSARLLLTGVIVASGCGAVVTLILALAPDTKLRGMLFWLMGDLNGVDRWQPVMLGLAGAALLVWPQARALNAMARGGLTAQMLGVNVRRLRLTIYAVASCATALAVTTAGSIGFIGLIVPHALRLVAGNDQRVLLPAAALGGGALLLAADTLARTIAAPLQLPVGAMMALLGVPSFLYLLLRRHDRT